MAKPKTPRKASSAAKKPVEDAVVVDVSDPPEAAISAAPQPETTIDGAPTEAADAPSDMAETPEDSGTPAQAPASKTQSRFVPMVIGGLVAGAIGFAAGTYLNLYNSQNSGTLQTELAQRDAQIQDLTSRLGTLQAQLGTLKGTVENSNLVSEPTLKTELAQQRAAIDTSLTGLAARIADLEKRPADTGATGDAAALSAYQDQLSTLKAALEAQGAKNDALAAEVQALAGKAKAVAAQEATNARATLAQAAVLRLRAALDGGAPLAPALADISASSDVAIPAALTSSAAGGVPTLANLRTEFPAAARQALAASRSADPATGTMGKLENFVISQLGVRSLEPKEGTSPDAVLSRAEAALGRGDLAATLNEIKSLPEAGQQKMAAWQAKAKTRMDALAAADALSQAIE